MKEIIRKRITELTDIVGISGNEWDVARYIKDAIKDYVDDWVARPNGMLIAHIKGDLPGGKKLISAHMDEVGYAVKSITPNGFIYFDKIGYPTEGCIPGRKVWVKGKGDRIPGIIGVRAGHLLTPEQQKLPQTVKQSYIDVGATSREEVLAMGIETGAQIVIDSPMTPMFNPDFIAGRAADCRALCAIIVEGIRCLDRKEIHGDLYFAFTVIEEPSSACGATAVHYCEPDCALFTDTIPAGDVPDADFIKELPVKLNGGPVILRGQYFVDMGKYCASHPKVVAALEESAAEANVEYQSFSFCGAGYTTDASTAMSAGNGTAVASLTLPRRYAHSPVEMLHLDDAVRLHTILVNFMKKDIDLNMM